MSTYHCERCNKEFTGVGKRRFCSLACRYAESKEERTCPTCGKTFLSYNTPGNERIYCTRSCVPKVDKKPIICAGCGKEFLAYDSQKGTKFCSRECRAKVKSTTYACENCGKEIHWFTKNPRRFCSSACRAAAKRVNTECPACGKAFWYHVSWPRIYCCIACSSGVNAIKNLGAYAVEGEENPSWDGGPVPYGPNWYRQREAARKRDNYTCQHCHVTESELGKELHVHHIVKFRRFGTERYQEANELTNLISLCGTCHPKAERGLILVRPRLL